MCYIFEYTWNKELEDNIYMYCINAAIFWDINESQNGIPVFIYGTNNLGNISQLNKYLGNGYIMPTLGGWM